MTKYKEYLEIKKYIEAQAKDKKFIIAVRTEVDISGGKALKFIDCDRFDTLLDKAIMDAIGILRLNVLASALEAARDEAETENENNSMVLGKLIADAKEVMSALKEELA